MDFKIISHALGLPAATKQGLLAEPNVEWRVNTLRSLLRQIVDDGRTIRDFPPDFSAN